MTVQVEAQKLLKQMLKVASEFKDPNFRSYFTRITADDFKTAPTQPFLDNQRANLETLQRQVLVQNLYFSDEFSVKR